MGPSVGKGRIPIIKPGGNARRSTLEIAMVANPESHDSRQEHAEENEQTNGGRFDANKSNQKDQRYRNDPAAFGSRPDQTPGGSNPSKTGGNQPAPPGNATRVRLKEPDDCR